MHRIELDLFLVPVPAVRSDNGVTEEDANLFDGSHHRQIMMGIGCGHRVVVAVETDQRQ